MFDYKKIIYIKWYHKLFLWLLPTYISRDEKIILGYKLFMGVIFVIFYIIDE